MSRDVKWWKELAVKRKAHPSPSSPERVPTSHISNATRQPLPFLPPSEDEWLNTPDSARPYLGFYDDMPWRRHKSSAAEAQAIFDAAGGPPSDFDLGEPAAPNVSLGSLGSLLRPEFVNLANEDQTVFGSYPRINHIIPRDPSMSDQDNLDLFHSVERLTKPTLHIPISDPRVVYQHPNQSSFDFRGERVHFFVNPSSGALVTLHPDKKLAALANVELKRRAERSVNEMRNRDRDRSPYRLPPVIPSVPSVHQPPPFRPPKRHRLANAVAAARSGPLAERALNADAMFDGLDDDMLDRLMDDIDASGLDRLMADLPAGHDPFVAEQLQQTAWYNELGDEKINWDLPPDRPGQVIPDFPVLPPVSFAPPVDSSLRHRIAVHPVADNRFPNRRSSLPVGPLCQFFAEIFGDSDDE